MNIFNKFDLSVVIPCYNESKNLNALVSRLFNTFKKKGIDGEVILVDDNSQDDSWELMNKLKVLYPDLRIFRHQENQGIAKGWETGLKQARGSYSCFMDADLQNLPEDVWRLYYEINFSHSDVVSGWRSHVEKKRDFRYLVSKSLNFLLNFLFGMNLKDNKSGFVMARTEVLRDILSHRFNYHHFQTFITVSAHAKKYSIRQIETLFDVRRGGRSYLQGLSFLKNTYYTIADIAKALFEFRFLDTYDNSLREFLKHNTYANKYEKKSGWRGFLFKVYKRTFPLHHWTITSHSVDYYDDLCQSQWLSPQQIKQYQEKKLRQLINHVYHHVPFYREVFEKNNLSVDDIRTIEDLQKLPIIDKQVVKDNLYLGLMSDSHTKKNIQKATTSGSTGQPFFTYLEKKQIEMRWAATLRSTEWTGYQFGDRQLRLWHKYLGLKKNQIIREIMDAKFTGRRFIPAYEMDDKALEEFMDKIDKHKPVLLDGYAESFNFIARFLKNKTYSGFKPKAIMSSAQTLPVESRRIIEECFGCKVFDKYGAREFGGGLAYQCEKGDGYHVVAECAIIEIVKDGKQVGPGEIGEVVITELNNYAVPLIRYRLGDLAIRYDNNQACHCGRGLPRIGEIQGRIQSMIFGTNNKFVPGSFFARLFADYEYAINQFQVVQEKLGELKFRIIKADFFDQNILDGIIEETKRHLGNDLIIDVDFVDAIELGRTGKRQHTVSTLDIGDILSKID